MQRFEEKINRQRAEIEAEKAIFDSLPEQVREMDFHIISPITGPFLSFKNCTLEQLRALKEFFPAIPQWWCDNTHGTEEEMKRKNSVILWDGKDESSKVSRFEEQAKRGRCFPLISPYVVRFSKLSYPESGRVTVVWETKEFRVWAEMKASDYAAVTESFRKTDVHLKEEQRKHEIYNRNPEAITPYLRGFSNMFYWGNSVTCFCKEGEDAEVYEKAIFYGI